MAHPVDVALSAIDLDSHMRAKLQEASTCADTLRSSIEVDWGVHRLLACKRISCRSVQVSSTIYH